MPRAREPGAAAFFDLDRTLISRSSSLCSRRARFAGGVSIGRRQLVQAAIAQLVFTRFGAGQARVGQTADSAMSVLNGVSGRDDARDRGRGVGAVLCGRSSTARPLDLAAEHACARGAGLHRLGRVAGGRRGDLDSSSGFDGALASRAEVADGVYTGRLERRLYGRTKADALEELAEDEGIDPRELDRLLGLAFGRSVSRGRRASRRGQPRPRAAASYRGSRLAGAALQPARVPGLDRLPRSPLGRRIDGGCRTAWVSSASG